MKSVHYISTFTCQETLFQVCATIRHLSNAVQQLKILKECGLVNMNKQGRERYCQVNPQGLIPAFLWMEQLQKQWESRIDSFQNYLTQLKAAKDEVT